MHWTDDELLAIREVALADEMGITPHDAYLPVYEKLREHGVLDRTMLDGEVTYHASESFRARAALMLHQASAELAARDN